MKTIRIDDENEMSFSQNCKRDIKAVFLEAVSSKKVWSWKIALDWITFLKQSARFLFKSGLAVEYYQ